MKSRNVYVLNRVIYLALGMATLASTGCESRPRAPLLRNGPVYDNSAEGIRFLVPEGWQQTAAAELPPGDLPDELFLVRYSLQTPDGGGMMQVLVLQDQGTLDLGKHHAGPSFRAKSWTPVDKLKELTINGTKLDHFEYKTRMDGVDVTKEVYALRRNGRVYSFVGVYPVGDEYARQQISRALESLQVK